MTFRIRLAVLAALTTALALTNCAAPGVPARDFLIRGEHPEGFGAYGYLVLVGEPGMTSRERYLAICDTYIRSFEAVQEFETVDRGRLMPTFWLLRDTLGVSTPQCDLLVSEYDYALATRIAGAVDRLASLGPLLVAWRDPFSDTPDSSNTALVFDMADFAESDFERAFAIWRDRIAREPDTWHEGWERVLIREALRNYAEKYGEHILDFIDRLGER